MKREEITIALSLRTTGKIQPVPEAERIVFPEGFRVLVVDDIALERRITTGLLERLGVPEVESAESGAAAYAAAVRRPPALVLTDMWMPGVDGSALRKLLAEDPRTRGVPVIAFTAEEDPQTAFNTSGFAGVLQKPITTLSLAAVLRRVKEGL